MIRRLPLALCALLLAPLLALPAAGQDDIATYEHKRRALRGRYAAAGSPAEKRAILAEFRALRLAVAVDRTEEAEQLIDDHSGWGTLDESGLGEDLADEAVTDPDLVDAVLDELGSGDRDDVSLETLEELGDDELADLAGDADGRDLLEHMVDLLNGGNVSAPEEIQIERVLPLISDTHVRLVFDAVSPAVAAALQAAGATLQPIADGSGSYVFDEYTVVIDRMPPGVSASDFLMEMALDLNGTVDDGAFDAVNRFSRRATGAPQPGDIYDIDILGPDNGSVVLAAMRWSSDASYFIFSTIATPTTGSHPEFGNREFGFFTNDDGSTTFYTRGASRPANWPTRQGGALPQATSWSRLMRGISNAIDARGGASRPGSFRTRRGYR